MSAAPSHPVMVGVSHRTAPLAVLERAAVSRAERPRLLAALRDRGCTEAVVVATAARTELYAVTAGNPATLSEGLAAALAEQCGLAPAKLDGAVRCRAGSALARHVLRVAAGLDSRLIGDPDIPRQLEAAAAEADRVALLGPVLGALFVGATRVRRAVDDAGTFLAVERSVGGWAVEVGLAGPARRRPHRALLIGEGRTASAAADHLARRGVRTHAATGPLDLADVDLVVCTRPHPGLLDSLTSAARDVRERRLTVVDTCLPRAVDPAVGTLPGVCLLDLDDLCDEEEHHHRLLPRIAMAEAIVRTAAGC